MPDNKLKQLLGDYRSDGSESDEADSDAGTSKIAASTKNDSKIDTNWTQCIDKNTGHPYYWNIVTKEVTWEIPDDYEQFLRQNVIDSNRRSEKNTWILCQGDDNTEYYFNEYTRAISWDKPADYVEPVVYVQPKIDESNTVQQVRGREYASRQTKSDRKSTDTSAQMPSINNSNNFVMPTSSSSIETESRQNAEKNSFQNEKSASINLVPEYNSDEDDTDSDVDNDNNHSKKPIDSSQVASSTTSQNSTEENKSMPFTKSMSSFASIIVGGRSPNQEAQISPIPDAESFDGIDTIESKVIELEHLPPKQFKRKRRIEFSVNHKRDKIQPENPDAVAIAEEASENNSTEMTVTSNKLTGNLYENFQRESHDSQPNCDRKSMEPEPVSDAQKIIEEISQLKDILESKLQFLCQGQKEIELKPVQVMHIQLQTLFEAHTVSALHSEYLLTWLNNVSSDLIQLEKDAAPAGWKCVWNREAAKYRYENLESGCVQFEYPEESNRIHPERDDDEMDICTTPPPPSTIDEPSNAVESRAFAPDPPNWSSAKVAFIQQHKATGEPLPPGIDPSESTETPLEDELATFYSDIASLDQTGAASTEPSTNPTSTISEKSTENATDSNSDITEEKKKKKRKKHKQLEPWRSGNLETWINKWQKAQKELDG